MLKDMERDTCTGCMGSFLLLSDVNPNEYIICMSGIIHEYLSSLFELGLFAYLPVWLFDLFWGLVLFEVGFFCFFVCFFSFWSFGGFHLIFIHSEYLGLFRVAHI